MPLSSRWPLTRSRTLTVITLVQSLGVWGGFMSAWHILLIPEYILTFPPQIWRFVTAFCLTGKKFNVLIDLYNSTTCCRLGSTPC